MVRRVASLGPSLVRRPVGDASCGYLSEVGLRVTIVALAGRMTMGLVWSALVPFGCQRASAVTRAAPSTIAPLALGDGPIMLSSPAMVYPGTEMDTGWAGPVVARLSIATLSLPFGASVAHAVRFGSLLGAVRPVGTNRPPSSWRAASNP